MVCNRGCDVTTIWRYSCPIDTGLISVVTSDNWRCHTIKAMTIFIPSSGWLTSYFISRSRTRKGSRLGVSTWRTISGPSVVNCLVNLLRSISVCSSVSVNDLRIGTWISWINTGGRRRPTWNGWRIGSSSLGWIRRIIIVSYRCGNFITIFIYWHNRTKLMVCNRSCDIVTIWRYSCPINTVLISVVTSDNWRCHTIETMTIFVPSSVTWTSNIIGRCGSSKSIWLSVSCKGCWSCSRIFNVLRNSLRCWTSSGIGYINIGNIYIRSVRRPRSSTWCFQYMIVCRDFGSC